MPTKIHQLLTINRTFSNLRARMECLVVQVFLIGSVKDFLWSDLVIRSSGPKELKPGAGKNRGMNNKVP